MVADDPQHVVCVFLVAREGPKLARHFGRCRIRHACHDRGQCPTHGAAFVAVVAVAHVHQQTADVCVAQTKRAEVVRPLRDFFGWELRHHHRDFERDCPETRGMHVVFCQERAVFVEFQQVHRRQVTGGVVQEHIFRARVGPTDRAIFWACVPVVDGIVVLDAGIGTGPCRVAHLFPQIAGFDGFGGFAVFAIDQFPVCVFFNGIKKRICYADRVVGVLARHA